MRIYITPMNLKLLIAAAILLAGLTSVLLSGYSMTIVFNTFVHVGAP